MRLKLVSAGICLLVGLCASLAQEMFPDGNFLKLRRGNCTNCHNKSPVSGAHLPRLSLIKQRILQALRGGGDTKTQEKQIEPTFLPKAFIAPKQTTTLPPENTHTKQNDSSGISEIVTFSETLGTENGDTIIKFKHHNHNYSKDVEAVGASLLLYINRRRKIRKGGRGKKIMLTISDYDGVRNSDEILTYLRTRVKKTRWKKLSLPLNVASKFLNSGDEGLSLKVKCNGCGRLVQLVFLNSETSIKSKNRKRKKHKERESEFRRRHRPETGRKRRTISARPILVISTRQKHIS